MHREKILVADSGETSRKKICELLAVRGYRAFQATDGPHVLRAARHLKPDLVILDTGLWGMPAVEVGRIIETDQLSEVLFLTAQITGEFQQMIRQRHVYAYLSKPLHPQTAYQVIEMVLVNAARIRQLTNQVLHLEQTLEGRKMVDRAKGLLMQHLSINEPDAYARLRRQAMNSGISVEKAAMEVISLLQADHPA